MPNIVCPELYPRKKRGWATDKYDAYIIENRYVHAKSIAEDISKTERFVVTRQRKLGVRPFTGNHRKGGSHERQTA